MDELRDIAAGLRRRLELLEAYGVTDIPVRASECKGNEARSSAVEGGPLRVVFIDGEAGPGEPAFPGETGETIRKIVAAMGLSSEDVVFCTAARAVKTLNSEATGVAVAFGDKAVSTLLGEGATVEETRGVVSTIGGVGMMATHHPATYGDYGRKKEAWDDLQEVVRYLSS